MLSRIQLRDFRCFPSLSCEFTPGRNVFIGANAQGKTSLLEAVCVLLRLQSPRVGGLQDAIRKGGRGFVLDGFFDQRHLQFYYSSQRKKLALDSVEQRSSAEYLDVARVVWFSNFDIEIVRGSAERRRAFLDFVAAQLDPLYLRHLRKFKKALRSRNLLLKMSRPAWREIEAFDGPLEIAGTYLMESRARLVVAIQRAAEPAHSAISGHSEKLELKYIPGVEGPFADCLTRSREEDARLRHTTIGPHRDDIAICIDSLGSDLVSEGQQRTIALALKLAQVALVGARHDGPPVMLIDDIFGELDPDRRNALVSHLPRDSQQFITTTNLDWLADREQGDTRILRLADRQISGD